MRADGHKALNRERREMGKRIYLPISSGVNARDLLRCGFLDQLQGNELVVITPLARHAGFRREFSRPHVTLVDMPPDVYGIPQALASRQRRWIRGHAPWLERAWRLASRALCPNVEPFLHCFRQLKPDVVALPTPRKENIGDCGLALAAQFAGVPTVCLVSSWDNPRKGKFRVHCNRAAVWNDINARDMVEVQGHHPHEVLVTGPMQMDPYFNHPGLLSRAEFCRRMGLDEHRRILLVATVGPLIKDQAFLVEELFSASDQGELAAPVQVIARVHFADRAEFFWEYERRRDFVLDRPGRWSYRFLGSPRGWTMDADDMTMMANLLRHSDVVISMGSTVLIEAAIFDTPGIAVAYSPHEPEEVRRKLDESAFRKHFRELVEQKLINIVRSREELIRWVNQYLADPSCHRRERSEVVRQIVQFTDGRSSERAAAAVLNAC
jgi:CDP-glycerol:poly(glycerophosphate) glycerophosphotransferase